MSGRRWSGSCHHIWDTPVCPLNCSFSGRLFISCAWKYLYATKCTWKSNITIKQSNLCGQTLPIVVQIGKDPRGLHCKILYLHVEKFYSQTDLWSKHKVCSPKTSILLYRLRNNIHKMPITPPLYEKGKHFRSIGGKWTDNCKIKFVFMPSNKQNYFYLS